MEKMIKYSEVSDTLIARVIREFCQSEYITGKYSVEVIDAGLDTFYNSLDSGYPVFRNENASKFELIEDKAAGLVWTLLLRNVKRAFKIAVEGHNRCYPGGGGHSYNIFPFSIGIEELYVPHADREEVGVTEDLKDKFSYAYEYLVAPDPQESINSNTTHRETVDKYLPKGEVSEDLRKCTELLMDGATIAAAVDNLGISKYYQMEYPKKLKRIPTIQKLAKEYGYA
jgi:hypothetical protein